MRSLLISSLLVAYCKLVTALQNRQPPSEVSAEMVDWKLCDAEVHSNLGGVGPDTGEEAIRYGNIATLGGGAVDLLVTNTTPYEYKSFKTNGVKGCFGKFNVIVGSSVTLSFRFVKAGTTDSVDPFNFLFTVYDVDESAQAAKEQVTFNTPVDGYWLMENTELITSYNPDLTFTSSVVGVGADNPEYPEELNALQEVRAVTVQYASQSEVYMTFTTLDEGSSTKISGRNFLFAGKSDLMEDAELTCTTADCEVWADPHVSGFDNAARGPISFIGNYMKTFDRQPVDVNVYEEGDFWLVKSDRIRIQGRYAPSAEFGNNRSAVGAIAIGGAFIDNGKLIIEPKNGKIIYNGQVIEDKVNFMGRPAGGDVHIKTYFDAVDEDGHAPAGVVIDLPARVRLKIRRYNTHLDAKITMPKLIGRVDGQCGNFNGNAADDSMESVKSRKNWDVSPAEVLFN